MSKTFIFRTVLISGLVISIFSVIASYTLLDTLPLMLQNYLAQSENIDMSTSQTILAFIAVLLILLFLPICTIGLWKFKSWARKLYIVITIIVIPFYPFIGPTIMNGWESMFNDTALILEGILIAMMFTGEINQKFQTITPKVIS